MQESSQSVNLGLKCVRAWNEPQFTSSSDALKGNGADYVNTTKSHVELSPTQSQYPITLDTVKLSDADSWKVGHMKTSMWL